MTVTDSADWQVGRHVWKFGVLIQRYKNGYGFVNDYGTLTFDGSVTGNAYADFLLGIPQSSARVNPLPTRYQYVGDMGLYAQDDYQISDRLTLNYGLRWDYYGTPHAPDHLMYNFDPATGDVVVDPRWDLPGQPALSVKHHRRIGSCAGDQRQTNFAPRVGVAYRLSQHSVIRGGYGLYTARLDGISDPQRQGS